MFDLVVIGLMYMLASVLASIVCKAIEAHALPHLGALALGARNFL